VLDVDESHANIIRALGWHLCPHPGRGGQRCRAVARPAEYRARAAYAPPVRRRADSGWRPAAHAFRASGHRGRGGFCGERGSYQERRFSILRKFMGYHDGGAGERFEPWCHRGEFGWAFDGDTHELDFTTGLVGIDLT
jgi:hypothetical protein